VAYLGHHCRHPDALKFAAIVPREYDARLDELLRTNRANSRDALIFGRQLIGTLV